MLTLLLIDRIKNTQEYFNIYLQNLEKKSYMN